MVQVCDIYKVSLQAKEEFVISLNNFEGKKLTRFLVKTFLHIPMGAFTYLFADSELGLKVFRSDGFGVEFDARAIELF